MMCTCGEMPVLPLIELSGDRGEYRDSLLLMHTYYLFFLFVYVDAVVYVIISMLIPLYMVCCYCCYSILRTAAVHSQRQHAQQQQPLFSTF